MKFPYGLSDFAKIIESGYWYQDRTDCLPMLEAAGDQLLFIRPRRFGKSLLLSMLEHYYDLNRADDFERLFGTLAIGRDPTPLRNRYFVMKWDFSLVKTHGTVREIEIALHQHLNDCIRAFALRYRERLDEPVVIHEENALSSWASALMAVSRTPQTSRPDRPARHRGGGRRAGAVGLAGAVRRSPATVRSTSARSSTWKDCGMDELDKDLSLPDL